MRSRDRHLHLMFLLVFATAVIAQGVGTKLVLRLASDGLPAVVLAGLVILAGAYRLLVVGLARVVGR